MFGRTGTFFISPAVHVSPVKKGAENFISEKERDFMQNSEKGESKYLIEAARNLAREGIVTEPIAYDALHVTLGGKRLCWVTDRGNIGYYKENVADEAAQEMLDHVQDIAQTTREYMTQLEQAPPLSASGIASEAGYGFLSEFNNNVLAGKATWYGAQFVTCEWVSERTGLYQGNYYGPSGGVKEYAAAKWDFAVRSSLLPSSALFTGEQLTEGLPQRPRDTGWGRPPHG